MSKDIRSFFKPKTNGKPVPVVNLSDDDVIPDSPDVQIKKKKKESKKRRIFDDSSDEEVPDKKTKSDNKGKPSSSKNKKIEKPLKEVKVSEIFGTEKIKRTEPIVKSEKKTLKTETGIHSDEELEKTLLELDLPEDVLDQETQVKEKEVKTNHDKDELAKEKHDKRKVVKENRDKEKEVKLNHGKDGLVKEKLNKESKVKERHVQETYTKEKQVKDKGSKEKEVKENPKEAQLKEKQHKNNHAIIEEEKDSKYFNNKKTPEKSTMSSSKTQGNDKSTKKNEAKTPKEIKKAVMNENAKKFSEFIDDSMEIDDGDFKSNSRKRKLDKTLNESVISDEERYEKKRHSAALYQSYLNRSGPKHLGSKEIPEGASNCLKDCAFLLTGVLDSFERDEIAEAITKYGGCIKSAISKKVTHVLAGEEAGPAKIAKAQELNIKIINEDEFLLMIKDSIKPKAAPKVIGKKDNDIKKLKDDKPSEKIKTEIKTPIKMEDLEKKVQKSFYGKKSDDKTSVKVSPKKEIDKEEKAKIKEEKVLNDDQKAALEASLNTNNQIWVDKYKPQNIKQIIGQHGEASNVKKLINWLTKWYINRKEKIAKPSPWSKSDDGAYFKAALLSGPPGVGKTTTVSLVCKELGFDMVEFNASDTRSKTLINEQISELLTTSSLSGFAKGAVGKQAVTKKHVLVMDEVDGMAGNEDRGGLQTLISLIKTSAVPIICMCNDRNSQKMRTLVNYCYDLKFSKPKVDQIKSAMLSVCYKEGLKVSNEAMTQIITEAQQDVRQVLNLLYMWSINCKQMNNDQVKKDSSSARKDIKLGPWEVVRKVFSAEEHKTMSIHDKFDLFFYDYSISPLFVQENYLSVMPHCPKKEILSRISAAADSLSMGDIVEKRIRGQMAWNLLPDQALLTSVIPGYVMEGHVAGQIQFPSWLGKNSSRNKMQRLCQEIHAHTRLTTSGSKSSIFLDYCTHLRNAIITPLIKDKVEGIPKTMEVLQSYNLLREDLDSLTMLSLWPGQRDPMVMIDSKVKAAMTRTYNKEACALPYAPGAVKKSKTVSNEDGDDDEDDTQDDNQDDTDPENDAMIKKKKKAPEKKTDANKPTTSKNAGKKTAKNQKKS